MDSGRGPNAATCVGAPAKTSLQELGPAYNIFTQMETDLDGSGDQKDSSGEGVQAHFENKEDEGWLEEVRRRREVGE